MTRPDKLTETHERLVTQIEAITSGDDWRSMLDVARHFHQYSPNNVWLILAQYPAATRVGGFHTWRKLGRFVRKGEQGIAILAPCVYRARPADETDDRDHPEPARILRGFRVVHVFDQAQTDGQDVPEVAPVLLDGAADEVLWQAISGQIAEAGFALRRADCSPANGTTDFASRVVTIRPDLSGAQATKTLVHELGHVRLHSGAENIAGCRGLAEVEAESVAYLVCASAGLATDGYSFPYVARWSSGNADLVRSAADRVITCAREILRSAGMLAALEGQNEGG